MIRARTWTLLSSSLSQNVRLQRWEQTIPCVLLHKSEEHTDSAVKEDRSALRKKFLKVGTWDPQMVAEGDKQLGCWGRWCPHRS